MIPARRAVAAFLAAAVALTGCGSTAGSGSAREATVLELAATAGSWTGLDPLANKAASINHDFFNAIYGRLFRRGPDGRIVPDLAAGFAVKNEGLEVDLELRPDVSFTDGTPSDASAVAFNINRDLTPAEACFCLVNFGAVVDAEARGPLTVALHLSRPDPAIIDAFLDAAPNWIVSPSALKRLGATRFAQNPVGAGPFVVVRSRLNSVLELKANPTYWRQGYPKLDRLTFTSVADDATAYTAMRAGQGDLYMAFGNPALLRRMTSRFVAVPTPATQTETINLNPRSPALRNAAAREAIYYATDPAAINAHIMKSAGTVSQAPGGPADLYWTAQVPGYRSYDLGRAQSLVRGLGGLAFTISVLNTPIQTAIVQALQSQWAEAGIKATISVVTIPQAVKQSHEGSLQAIATMVGSYNPSLVPGVAASYSSRGPFSLVKDAELDRLVYDAAAEPDADAAAGKYQSVYARLSEKAYAPMLFTMPQWTIATRDVGGLTPEDTEVDWATVSVT